MRIKEHLRNADIPGLGLGGLAGLGGLEGLLLGLDGIDRADVVHSSIHVS